MSGGLWGLGEHGRTQTFSYIRARNWFLVFLNIKQNIILKYPTSRFFSFPRNMQILTLVCLITNNFGETLDEVITDEIWDENDFFSF